MFILTKRVIVCKMLKFKIILQITILHGGKDIVSSTLEEKARANIMEKLKEKNIDVLFGNKN